MLPEIMNKLLPTLKYYKIFTILSMSILIFFDTMDYNNVAAVLIISINPNGCGIPKDISNIF